MSGIYIPGMEMPKDCGCCPFRHSVKDYDFCWAFRPHARLISGYGISENCPLVSVPDHGRLIDADALFFNENVIGKMMVFGGEYVYTQSAIDKAKTIIQADKESNNDQ